MFYSEEEVLDFINNNDVKFIRLSFCDVKGTQKNISIMPSQFNKALLSGIAIDASYINGFDSEDKRELFLFPDINTLSLLPWRPSQGRVVRFYCDIKYPDGKLFELDGRKMLKDAIKKCKEKGYSINIGSECEFYLFKKDYDDKQSFIPFDEAGYLDVAPLDKGENVRREICLTLEEMSIIPESSHHEAGPGQNEIDFKYADALKAADDLITLRFVVSTIADRNGLWACFSPKPIADQPGNGLHVNLSVKSENGTVKQNNNYLMAGIMKHIKEITCFLNSTEESYLRLGNNNAPKYITWSMENRSQLLRVPCENGEYERIELTSPDSLTNPYIAYTLLLYAGLEGLEEKYELCVPTDAEVKDKEVEQLPNSYQEAVNVALESEFVNKHMPKRLLDLFR